MMALVFCLAQTLVPVALAQKAPAGGALEEVFVTAQKLSLIHI